MSARKRIFLATIFFLCFIVSSINAAPESQSYEEYAIKTAFLYRSLHYVDWSDKNTDEKMVVICFTRPDKFVDTMQSLQNRKVNERTIKMLKVASYSDIHGCDVMYIPIVKLS